MNLSNWLHQPKDPSTLFRQICKRCIGTTSIPLLAGCLLANVPFLALTSFSAKHLWHPVQRPQNIITNLNNNHCHRNNHNNHNNRNNQPINCSRIALLFVNKLRARRQIEVLFSMNNSNKNNSNNINKVTVFDQEKSATQRSWHSKQDWSARWEKPFFQ